MSKKNKHLITITKDTLGATVAAYAADRAKVLAARADVDARRAALLAQVDEMEKAFTAEHGEEEARLDGVLESVTRYVTRYEASVFPPGQRHIDIGNVRLGIRATPWAVTKTGRETWEEIAIGMRDMEGMSQYVRVKYSVDKEALLRDRESFYDGSIPLANAGLWFAQDDVVFIEASS